MSDNESVSSHKKKHSKKKGLNKANTEVVTPVISDEKIKEKINNIEFEPYLVKNSGFSEYITNLYGNKNRTLAGQTILFFYNPRFESTEFNPAYSQTLPLHNVLGYILNLKKKLEIALNIPKVIKGFRVHIAYLDGVTDENTMKTLPRYLKMKRLEGLYKTVIEIGLTIIHNYYWDDICKNEPNIELSLKECIEKASPTIIKLKHDFEEQVRTEYEYDADEEKLIMLNRKY